MVAPQQTIAKSPFVFKESKFHQFQLKQEYVCEIGKYYPKIITHVYADIVETRNYKNKCLLNEEIIDCVWNLESSRGKNLSRGDKGLAYGHFQIHLIDNPEVTEECAMDYQCSKQWTINQFKIGNCWKWPTYYKCI